MFPKNTYLLPQAAPDSVVDFNGVEILLHPQIDLYPNHHYLTQNGSLIEASNLVSGELNVPQKKQVGKKDRHSKIYTSQGLRDRRVRLSIGMARKFFDLQEMLGFDKPSKTLDWLLTKSKAAIKELVQTKKLVSIDANSPEHSKGKNVEKRKEGVETHQVSAKESRVKARARARERTKEKMCIKNLTSELNTGFNIRPVQNRNNQLEFLQLFAGSSCTNASFLKVNLTICELPVLHFHEEESDLIRRKSKNTCYSGIHQDAAASRDFCSNYTPSAAENNWDKYTLEPSHFVILDQQKFINSTPNI